MVTQRTLNPLCVGSIPTSPATFKGVNMTHKIIRYLDKTGRITIPNNIREELNWNPRIPLLIDVSHHTVLIQDLKNSCIFCNKIAIHKFKNYPICESCYQELQDGSK